MIQHLEIDVHLLIRVDKMVIGGITEFAKVYGGADC